MDFFLRLMGWVAQHSEAASRSRHNGVPQNLQGVALMAFLALVLWLFYSFDGNLFALAGAILSALITLAVAVSMGCQNTFFIKEPIPEQTAPVSDAVFSAELRWTGRLRLNQQVGQRFMDVPVRATRLKDGTMGVYANIDASSKLYGFTINSKVGVWWSLPRAETLEFEAGRLYFGFKSAPSLRVKFTDKTDGKASQVIISFTSPEARAAFYTWLVAEKSKISG